MKPVKATLGKSVLKQYSTDRKPSIKQQHHKITAETTTAAVPNRKVRQAVLEKFLIQLYVLALEIRPFVTVTIGFST